MRITLSARDPWLLSLLQEITQINTPAERSTFVKQRLSKIYSLENNSLAFKQIENTTGKIQPIQDAALEQPQHQGVQSQQQEMAPQPFTASLAPSEPPVTIKTPANQSTTADLTEMPHPR
ncbi:hypothetical protein [Melaminivora jejuensis]|uniref:hypothetical protein n=1 Tax=Melaminivora jejuensis TaxID=1267217 RepID=UPI001ADF0069|nr:hypothetical protein [Melaminivora jejuensis]